MVGVFATNARTEISMRFSVLMQRLNINLSFAIKTLHLLLFTLPTSRHTEAKSRSFTISQIFRNFVGKKGKP